MALPAGSAEPLPRSAEVVIVGGGIMGLATAIVLRKKGHSVGLLNPGSIPHPLAASTDISKIVRMEYGSDTEYMDMADHCIGGWKAWNEQFNDTLYHEVGFLLLVKKPLTPGSASFENAGVRASLNGDNFFTFTICTGDDNGAALDHIRQLIARRCIRTQE